MRKGQPSKSGVKKQLNVHIQKNKNGLLLNTKKWINDINVRPETKTSKRKH